ncbi:precorrin-6A/cobalt-precorrin-6A reductase [Palleronia caenipelagi]|uniref:Cobalt-precorrin-6A reductase n=1 Tax=Palleronia caenipelagi TaxID=2489174 RepID=A0A547Q589_9RHOB|nr:precorrin-6A/cobalt-precorrin-6A reductase [Palleronia caenipelagi]TRD21552.1 cobalt-precorrin-6A reductase [Palleronia caenipelagi]
MTTRVLLLAGTSEARDLAASLALMSGVTATASLSRPSRVPQPLGIPSRIGGFGGDEGFRAYLRDERVGAVLDATHPFATRISFRSARICAEEGLPYGQFLRPAWTPLDGDRWHFAADEAEAAALVPPGARIFLTTGRAGIDRYGRLEGREVVVRQLGEVPSEPPPFETGRWLFGRPPFSVDEEVELFRKLGIDWMIVRNSGGTSSRSKLDAARRLGINVAMIRRPMQPDAIRFESLAYAVSWLRRVALRDRVE